MTSKQLESKKNYELKKNLGNGAFGIVSKIKVKEAPNPVYAIKQINLKKANITLDEAMNEYKILSEGLKNVVPAFGCFHNEKDETFVLSMEYFKFGSLNRFLKKRIDEGRGNLKFNEFLPLFRDIVTGMNSLSKRNVIHRDLKPENILIKQGLGEDVFTAFVGDVGAAKIYSTLDLQKLQTITSQVGTFSWMAPEMIGNPSKTIEPTKLDPKKLDVFSLGLMSLYCLDSKDYDNEKNLLKEKEWNLDAKALHDIYLPRFKTEKKENGITVRDKIPDIFFYMIKSMLSFDWNTRPTFQELEETLENFTNSQLNQLQLSNKEHEEREKELNEKNLKFSEQVRGLTEENVELQVKYKDLKGKYEELSDNFENSLLSNNHLGLKYNELQGKFKNIEDKNKGLESKINQQEQREKGLNDTNLKLSEVIRAFSEKNEGLERKLKEINGKYEELCEKHKKFEQKNEILKVIERKYEELQVIYMKVESNNNEFDKLKILRN